MKNEKGRSFRLGIIGLGTMGQFVADGALQHKDFELVSVFDPSLVNLSNKTSVDEHSYAHIDCETSAYELVARDDVDVVYIASPPNTHIDYCRLVLQAGKAIWCEKPLAVDIEDAAAFVTELTSLSLNHPADDASLLEHKGKAVVNLSLASSPELTAMKSIIDGEQLGQLSHVDIRLRYSAWPRHWQQDASDWLSMRAQGGFIREVFTHFVFMHQRLLGDMQLKYSHVSYPILDGLEGKNSAEVAAMAEYSSNGLPVRFIGSVGGHAPDVNEWVLYGEDQSLRYRDFSDVQLSEQSMWKTISLTRTQGSVALQLDEVSLMMQGQPHKLASFKEALAVQRVVEQTLQGGR